MLNMFEVTETNNMIEHEKLDAVSYTHLDVYKRQDERSPV